MPDSWSDGLPHCLPLDGQSEGLADNLVRSQPEAGPAQTRPRSSAMPRPFTGMVVCDRTQLATLRTFYSTTLLQGSLPFNFPAQSEAGTWLVRFTAPPKWVPNGRKYSVSIEIEILP